MNDATFFTTCVVVGVLMLVPSVFACRCNVRRFRAVRGVAPLDGLDLTGAAFRPPRAPRGWPAAEDIVEPATAAAYAALADDRLSTRVFAGELLTLVGGAAVGTLLASLDLSWGRTIPLSLAIGATAVAVAFGQVAQRAWRVRYLAYRDRYRALTATPMPERPRRRGLLGAVFRR